MRSAVKKPMPKWLRISLLSFAAILMVAIGVGVAVLIWYNQQLKPVDSGGSEVVSVSIQPASTPSAIADLLKEADLIRSPGAFLAYTRLNGVQGKLQAGNYRLSKSKSTPEIVDYLVKGKVDTLQVTFYPGATLVDNTPKADDKKHDVTNSLRRAGFSDVDIQKGLNASYPEYENTLFQGRPSTADLEGYIYGDTYHLSSGSTVESVLKTSFDQFWKVINDNNLVEAYKKQGLTLFEGITLASIVQRESIGGDEPGIAQVFFARLSIGMMLGSDVTYQYIADKTGVARDPNLNSPYNTRRFTGLTPGPIAVPGLASLKAVANPAGTDYLYFLSGDDDITYFGRTLSDHESNIANHCRQKCQIL